MLISSTSAASAVLTCSSLQSHELWRRRSTCCPFTSNAATVLPVAASVSVGNSAFEQLRSLGTIASCDSSAEVVAEKLQPACAVSAAAAVVLLEAPVEDALPLPWGPSKLPREASDAQIHQIYRTNRLGIEVGYSPSERWGSRT